MNTSPMTKALSLALYGEMGSFSTDLTTAWA